MLWKFLEAARSQAPAKLLHDHAGQSWLKLKNGEYTWAREL